MLDGQGTSVARWTASGIRPSFPCNEAAQRSSISGSRLRYARSRGGFARSLKLFLESSCRCSTGRANNMGTFGVPPPVLTRAYQDLGLSMIRFHQAIKFTVGLQALVAPKGSPPCQAQKIVEVPFPLPYVVAARVQGNQCSPPLPDTGPPPSTT